jgi:hypothetical protein
MFELAPRPLWWLPTLGFFLFFAIEAFALYKPSQRFDDPGVGRHLRNAEVILATHTVPRADSLSFTRAGRPWYDFEWAFEATVGELNRAGGLGLVLTFISGIFAATVLGIYRTLLQTGASTAALVLVTGLAFLTLHMHYSARPVLFTYLFMAVVVEVWRRRTVPLARDWVLLPVIFVAWANLHAGWAAALVFMVLSIAGRTVDRFRGKVSGEEAPVIPWIALGAVCTFATTFNPWGWKLLPQVFLFSTTYKSFALWNEYAPPNFNEMTMSAITVLFLLIVFLAARAFRQATRWRWEIVLPILFFLYEGLKAQRHVILLMEIAAVPLAVDLEVVLRGLSSWWWPQCRDRLRRFQERQDVTGDHLGWALAAALVLWVPERLQEFQARQRLAGADAWLALLCAIFFGLVGARTGLSSHITVGSTITPQLVTFIRDHPDRFARPLVTTANAGPLLWNLRPDFRVSFDDRGDFYGDETVFAFVDLYNAAPRWRKVFDEGNYDSVILDRFLALNQVLALLPGWKTVYFDKKTIVYWRARPVALPTVAPPPPVSNTR